MILTASKIKQEISAGNLTIEPFSEENLKASSYTFTLSSRLQYVEEGQLLRTDRRPAYRQLTMDREGHTLHPGEFVLGYTNEKLTLHNNYSCLLSNRSSCAQIGLDVLLSSTYAEPDTDNTQTLEIKNVGNNPILLLPGMQIVKGVFFPVSS